MNWETILWILAGILISEVIFIFWWKFECERESETSDALASWGVIKFMSFLFGGFITGLHAGLVFGEIWDGVEGAVKHYEYLLCLVIIWIIILINKWIAKKIEKKYG